MGPISTRASGWLSCSMKSPAFQFYPADYTSSQRVRLLTLEEEGAYINLLCSCWLHGSIPSDPAMAARLIGKGASTTLATTVLTMFTPSSQAGRMVHERLERERLKQADWREKSASGGRRSAELRKGGATTLQPPLPNGLNQKATLQSTSTSTSMSMSSSLPSVNTASVPDALVFPQSLSTSEFADAWKDWVAYRKERGQTLKPTTIKAQLAKMQDWGAVDAVAAIRQSILNGYQGIFEPRSNGQPKKPGGTSTYEMEARAHGYTM